MKKNPAWKNIERSDAPKPIKQMFENRFPLGKYAIGNGIAHVSTLHNSGINICSARLAVPFMRSVLLLKIWKLIGQRISRSNRFEADDCSLSLNTVWPEGPEPDLPGAQIYYAATTGIPSLVEALLDDATIPRLDSIDGWSPLVLASARGNLDVVKTLLRYGYDSNVVDYKTPLSTDWQRKTYRRASSITALLVALNKSHARHRIMHSLLEYGAAPNARGASVILWNGVYQMCERTCPFNNAICSHDTHAARSLLEKGANVNVMVEPGLEPPLYLACVIRDLDVVHLLLNSSADVNVAGSELCTPLIAASCKGNSNIVALLLLYEAEIEKETGSFGTALQVACYDCPRNDTALKIAELLIRAGANVDAIGLNSPSPLVGAARYGCVEIIQLLLYSGAELDKEVHFHGTALQSLCQNCPNHKPYIATGRLLIEAGANVNSQACEKLSPLVSASGTFSPSLELIGLLIGHGADVNLESQGRLPLEEALHKGTPELVEFLLQRGADITRLTSKLAMILSDTSYPDPYCKP